MSRDEVFDALADGTRREALRIVHERSPGGVAKTDLAYELAAVTDDKPLAAVTEDDHRRARLDCTHRILPALLGADILVETDDGRLVTADRPLFDDAELAALLELETTDYAGDLDGLFAALSDSRRRTILTVLANQYHPISAETLARDVAAREDGTAERAVSRERVDEVRLSLHHLHLPLLRDAGLIGYDGESETVSYEGHPDLRVEWLETDADGADETAVDPGADSENERSATDESAADSSDKGVRTLEGRERIVATGQSLCERADDELFMMFTTTGLLEEGCIRRIEDALDRGVDVYVGSPDPRVRELVRERVPEATLWESQLDWLDLPANGESVGRLVFADREAVMLGTLGTPAGDNEYDETAILGEGPGNGLVVLMRQLLGSRLDSRDAIDETVEFEISL
ncbi:hypothetical protein Htur_1804 [Haloterrigena turkmenica DSM 5511]|uniref:DUF7344 domain-containing protein n=1 Tax=Haloterrigena turkmenica (strain ATCC 51198 / DSM 5511 / JCM 9101 / NCIMB 13204 / VKM B-1734 / 4k) TaxID=543526 RepID=D2RSA8_HALTV|nr:hypothetical protein [Haloterrigena turkmenica]ADB60689.1 hypothetical protein Htur_1804 [Haloterrigena turkmenica DSM 5511]